MPVQTLFTYLLLQITPKSTTVEIDERKITNFSVSASDSTLCTVSFTVFSVRVGGSQSENNLVVVLWGECSTVLTLVLTHSY